MTRASPGDADLRRLRRLGRYLLGAQKLGIMIRKCNDPEHLDAYIHGCRLEWRFTRQKELFGENTQDRISNIERVHRRSELSNIIYRAEKASTTLR